MSTPIIPARKWHPATCLHKWCNCYDETSHATDGDCRWCRRNKGLVQGADPITRHPEGQP